jgi:hypothetical protein
VLRSHRDARVERLKAAVLRDLSENISALVQKEVDRVTRSERPPGGRKRATKR